MDSGGERARDRRTGHHEDREDHEDEREELELPAGHEREEAQRHERARVELSQPELAARLPEGLLRQRVRRGVADEEDRAEGDPEGHEDDREGAWGRGRVAGGGADGGEGHARQSTAGEGGSPIEGPQGSRRGAEEAHAPRMMCGNERHCRGGWNASRILSSFPRMPHCGGVRGASVTGGAPGEETAAQNAEAEGGGARTLQKSATIIMLREEM